MLASETMRMLTGYRLGACPTTVRPSWECSRGGSWMSPTSRGGHWFNVPCPHGVNEVNLLGEDIVVTEVAIDGFEIDPTAYEVRHGHILARIDGETWPLHQDLMVGADQPGSFTVTYVPGPQVDALGQHAAGLLACEYAKAIGGDGCRLPSNAVNVARQGVTVELKPDDLTSTGIREVDLYVRRWNPNRLLAAPTVWSPDTDARPARPSLVATGSTGPRGPVGPAGPPGSGGGGGGSAALLFTQATPAASWSIPHAFGRVPDVIVYSASGEVIYPDVSATSTAAYITFSIPTAGSAVLN